MALINTTTPLSAQGALGSGILHPIVKNRFCVSFHDAYDPTKLLPFSNHLAMQVTKLSDYHDGSGALILDVEDDVTNKAAQAVQALRDHNDIFCFVVSYLDGNESIVRQAKFANCKTKVITYSGMDYASQRADEVGRIAIPHTQGALIDALGAHPAALAVVTMLNGTTFTLYDKHPKSAVSTIKLAIDYESIELIFS